VSTVVYDAGALIAAERNVRTLWADHRARLEAGILPHVPAPVVAQVSRSARQAQLRRLLRGCDVVAFDEREAHAAGELLGRAGSADIVDASVVVLARRTSAAIVTSDRPDIAKLLDAAGIRTKLVDV
jgi:PIN domain